MRRTNSIVAAGLLFLAACGGPTSPGGAGGGSTVGHVTVGNTYFRSDHNASLNPAVDTVPVGATVTWTWNASGTHSIQSTGLSPAIFRNSVVMPGPNSTYAVTFKNPGTYPYNCVIHGSAMTGVIVVQ